MRRRRRSLGPIVIGFLVFLAIIAFAAMMGWLFPVAGGKPALEPTLTADLVWAEVKLRVGNRTFVSNNATWTLTPIAALLEEQDFVWKSIEGLKDGLFLGEYFSRQAPGLGVRLDYLLGHPRLDSIIIAGGGQRLLDPFLPRWGLVDSQIYKLQRLEKGSPVATFVFRITRDGRGLLEGVPK